MTLAVHHLAVVTSDLARSEHFYRDILGLAVLQRHADASGAPRAVWLALDAGAFLALELAKASEPTRHDQAPGWHCVALRIERADRDTWTRRLRDAGHPVERESAFTLYVRDPDGNLLGLSHHPEPID